MAIRPFIPALHSLLWRTALLFVPVAAQAVGSFDIEIVPGPGLSANPAAMAAFQRAAQEWENYISSPITIYLSADLSTSNNGVTFGPNTIGSTAFTTYNNFADVNLSYDTVRNALAAHASQPGDGILAFLPTQAQVTAATPAGATLDNTTIGTIRANQRALGLLSSTDTRPDATIVFNSAFTFDYDSINGIDPSKIDFQTAAAHEIGHALGFLSDVDDFDTQPGLASDNLTTLDLFRFPTSHVPTTGLEFETFSRELTPGVASVTSDTQVQYAMSTGAMMGDGNQAGHWQDDFLNNGGNITIGSLIGIMDPTLPFGASEQVGPADVRAIDLIGYNVVPEPSSAAMLLFGGCLLGVRRRR